MKVYINRQPVSGPWGGGNKTVIALSQALRSSGRDVVYDLRHGDIDLIFCFDPRPNEAGESYGDMWNYMFHIRYLYNLVAYGTALNWYNVDIYRTRYREN